MPPKEIIPQKETSSINTPTTNATPTINNPQLPKETPVQNPQTKTPQPNQKITYKYVGKKESLIEVIEKVFPKEMIPTKTLGSVFGIIFLIVILIGIASFPFGKILSGQTDIAITIGLPWEFLIFDLGNPETPPLAIGGLVLDLLAYLIISYIINIIINVFFGGSLFKRKNLKKFPKQYNLQEKKTIAEKATEKIIQKIETKKPQP